MKTQEIRWFSNSRLKSIEETFDNDFKGYVMDESRVDTYLHTPCADINLKLRDNLLEIKKRTSNPRSRIKIGKSSGYLENWIKWQVDSEIGLHSPEHWHDVKKRRRLVHFDAEGQLALAEDGEKPAGMQIEYTELSIDGSISFSLAVEWTVEKTETHCDILKNLLKKHELILRQSMGYPEYLGLLLKTPLELHES